MRGSQSVSESLGSATLSGITLAFLAEGGIELRIAYDFEGDLPNPGTKTRMKRDKKMALAALKVALEVLEEGEPIWGGFAQGRTRARDTLLVEKITSGTIQERSNGRREA